MKRADDARNILEKPMGAMNRFQQLFDTLDLRLVVWMRRSGIQLIRITLAVVFIWFGALKVIGRSPVVDWVAKTVYWLDPNVFVPFLGAWEILVGIGYGSTTARGQECSTGGGQQRT